jgi:hypothetical protein
MTQSRLEYPFDTQEKLATDLSSKLGYFRSVPRMQKEEEQLLAL